MAAASASSKKTSLIFCEPSSFNYKNDYLVLDVDDKMQQLIYEGGQPYQDGEGNAYVFGSLFSVDSYDHPGYVEVTNGEIGFVEQMAAKKRYKAKESSSDYEKHAGSVKYNDPVYLANVRKDYPEITWIGQVFGKPNGVHLHFHVDDELDRVDSIIIDNSYFFNVKYNSADESTDDDDVPHQSNESTDESYQSDESDESDTSTDSKKLDDK